MARLTAGLLLLLVAGSPGALAGQSLDDVDRLIRDGRVQEARETLLAWDEDNPSPSREARQRGLWFRGVLNLDPAQAANAFRRLVVEYPGGPFTDLALQRLALAAAFQEDLRTAEGHFSLLARDYPGSPARPQAVEWLARNRRVLDSLRTADAASGTSGLQPAPVPPRSDPGQVRRTSPTEPPEAPAGNFAAQLGAFSTRERAEAHAQRVEAAGFEPRIVGLRGDGFLRVRVGRFRDAEEARRMVARLRAAGFDAALATDVSRESAGG